MLRFLPVAYENQMSFSEAWIAFRIQFQHMFTDFSARWVDHPWSDIAAISWLFVSFSAGAAVFSKTVRDTALERVALAAICLGGLGRGFYIFARADIPSDAAWIGIALAFYCGVLWWKHIYVIPRRPNYVPPDQLPKH